MGELNDKLNYLKDTKKCICEAINSHGITVTTEHSFRDYADLIRDILTDKVLISKFKEILNISDTPTKGNDIYDLINITKKKIQNSISNKGVEVSDDLPFYLYSEKIDLISGTKNTKDEKEVDLTGNAPLEDFNLCKTELLNDGNYQYKYKAIFMSYIPKKIKYTVGGNVAIRTSDNVFYSSEKELNISHEWDNKNCPESSKYKNKKIYWYIVYSDDIDKFRLDPTIHYFCIDGFAISPKFYSNNLNNILGSDAINDGSIKIDPLNSYMALAIRSGPLTYPSIDLQGVTDASYILEDQYNMLVSPKIINSKQVKNFEGFLSWCPELRQVTPFDASGATNISKLFMNSSSIKKIPPLDFTNVEKVDAMFMGCTSLEELPYLNFRKVTSLGNQFLTLCNSLKRINGINLKGVTDIHMLFFLLASLEYVKLENTRQIKNFSSLFDGCSNLMYVEGLDLFSAEDTAYLFSGCSSLKTMENIKIDNLNNVKSYSGWFYNCSSLIEIPEYSWEQSESMTHTFGECVSLKGPIRMVLSKCLSLYGCFRNCISLSDVQLLDTGKCTSFEFTFEGSAIEKINKLDTSGAETLEGTFKGCNKLNSSIDFETKKVSNLKDAFYGCSSLTQVLQLSTESAKKTDGLFQDCQKLTDIPEFNFQNNENSSNMFNNCVTLESIKIIKANKLKNTSGMFKNCHQLKSLELIGTCVSEDVSEMFNSCYMLENIPKIDFSNATKADNIFSYCYSIQSVDSIDLSSAKLDTNSLLFGYCISLETVGTINFSSTQNANAVFVGCEALKSVEEIILSSSCTSAHSVFQKCYSLIKAPKISILGNIDLSYFFYDCLSLKEVPEYDLTNVSRLNNMFYNCSNLENVLLKNIPVSLDLSASTKFTSDSLVTVLNNLKKVSTKQTLTLGSVNLAKLTAEQKAIATNKGWTLA